MGRARGLDRHAIRGFGAREIGRAARTGWVLTRGAFQTATHKSNGLSRREMAARVLREAFEELGPTYVKLGQVVASSPLFPDEFSAEFQRCLDEVPPFPYDQVREVIAADLGRVPEDLFEWFDPTPLASASMAQVHVARTHDGRDVIVKVQRPGIRERLESDLRILMRIAYAVDRRSAKGRMANPIVVVDDLAGTLDQELDFTNEGRAMEKYEANLRTFGHNDGVRIPTVHWDLTAPRVITMERIQGCKIDDVDEVRRLGFDPAEALKSMARAFMEAAFEHGFFHGDMHAGNLMMDTEGRIVLLDFGIVGRFHPYTLNLMREGLLSLFLEGECETLARGIYQMSPGSREEQLEQASLELARMLEPILAKPLSEMSLGGILVEFINIGALYDLRMPHELVMLVKQLLYVERYIKLMAPEWVMMSDPLMFQFMLSTDGDRMETNGNGNGTNGNGTNGHGTNGNGANGHGTNGNGTNGLGSLKEATVPVGRTQLTAVTA